MADTVRACVCWLHPCCKVGADDRPTPEALLVHFFSTLEYAWMKPALVQPFGHLREGRAKSKAPATLKVAVAQAEVYESAAVAVQPGGEGAERLVVYVVLKDAAPSIDTAQLAGALGKRIARELNPLFKIHDLVVVDSLPRTASNKLMRRTLRDRYAGLAEDRPLR